MQDYVPSQTSHVLVYPFPFEGENEMIKEVSSNYGTVISVDNQQWPGCNVGTGTRLVHIERKEHIPRSVKIDDITCKVWYKDQPLQCYVCSGAGHKAADCPMKGKCLRCHQKGHKACNCTNAWAKTANTSQPKPTEELSGEIQATASVSGHDEPINSLDLRDNQLDEVQSVDSIKEVSASSESVKEVSASPVDESLVKELPAKESGEQNSEVQTPNKMEGVEGSSHEDLTQCSQSQSVLKDVGTFSQTEVFVVPKPWEQRSSLKESGDVHKASRSRSRSR